jgi:hypothetical protein
MLKSVNGRAFDSRKRALNSDRQWVPRFRGGVPRREGLSAGVDVSGPPAAHAVFQELDQAGHQ